MPSYLSSSQAECAMGEVESGALFESANQERCFTEWASGGMELPEQIVDLLEREFWSRLRRFGFCFFAQCWLQDFRGRLAEVAMLEVHLVQVRLIDFRHGT